MDLEVEEEVLPAEARGVKPPTKKRFTKKEEKESLINMGAPLVTAAKLNELFDGKPYYLHPLFDWRIKHLWQNDPKAVKYWTQNIKQK